MTSTNWEDLKELQLPQDRAARAKELMDQKRAELHVLSEIRAQAILEMRLTASAEEVAEELAIGRQQVNRIEPDRGAKAALADRRKEPHRPWLFDFVVPDHIDITEEPPEGKFFTADPIPNPLLERLRAVLKDDPRWRLARVAPIRRDRSNFHEQHLVVWVYLDGDGTELLNEIRGAMVEVVSDIVIHATLRDVRQSVFY